MILKNSNGKEYPIDYCVKDPLSDDGLMIYMSYKGYLTDMLSDFEKQAYLEDEFGTKWMGYDKIVNVLYDIMTNKLTIRLRKA